MGLVSINNWMSVCKRKQLLLKYLLAEEIEDEEMLSAPRLEKHAIFKRRQGERYFKILINNHLLGDDVKFFRLNKLQFDFVLSLVKQDIKKSSANCIPYPVSPEEKLRYVYILLHNKSTAYRSKKCDHFCN